MKNLVILIGNLGADPEKKYVQSGKPVATFTVATTEKWKGQDGQVQEQTEWHRVIAWNALADICAEYLIKGSRVYIEGKLQTRSWEKEGQKHYTTEIIAREMKMLSSKQGQSSGGGDGYQEPPPMGENVPF